MPLSLSAHQTDAADSDKARPRISRWPEGKAAAVSLRFDDNLDSHVRTVIPLLNRFGMKGTFMVSPGRSTFTPQRDFWLDSVPGMGHELGNHTMHHRGAKTLAEAEYEIGEAARIIRERYPHRSPLVVFASGGGKYWGGKRWSQVDGPMKNLAVKHHLIDLYDGSHPYIGGDSKENAQSLSRYVEDSMGTGTHRTFTFHQIGSPRWRDLVHKVLKGRSLSFPAEEFENLLAYLDTVRDNVWIAPLGDVLKYEAEYNASSLAGFQAGPGGYSFELAVETTQFLYDHDLTIRLPVNGEETIQVMQNGDPVARVLRRRGDTLVNLKPVSSQIVVRNLQ